MVRVGESAIGSEVERHRTAAPAAFQEASLLRKVLKDCDLRWFCGKVATGRIWSVSHLKDFSLRRVAEVRTPDTGTRLGRAFNNLGTLSASEMIRKYCLG